MSDAELFALHGPLPVGRLVVEASAGTGKTHTLATLAMRYVVEAGVAVDELLVVTFTRAAAAELKDRVRARLAAAAAVLREPSPEMPIHDPVLAALVATDRDRRQRRAETALADFDAATITTIHGFAQLVLGSLGSAVRADRDAVLADDTDALVQSVATDLLATEAVLGRWDEGDLPDLATLTDAARLAIGNADARIVPDPEPAGDDADASGAMARALVRRRLVDEVTRGVAERRRAAGTLSFDDLVEQLRDAVTDPGAAGHAARRALRQRYRVALIDEFQDTDPAQWAIFDALAGDADGADHGTGDDEVATTLVLVGDPKQAIYAFRGANVHTYLDAAGAAGTVRRELGTNWRSDGELLRALEVLLEGATFGDDRITFTHVEPCTDHRRRRMTAVDGTPLPTVSLRLADGPAIARAKTRPHRVLAGPVRDATYADLATHVRDLLERAHIPDPDAPEGTRPLRPDDVAVLIAAGHEGPEIRRALDRVGIPAVITRGEDVLRSEAASHWHLLLAALARPADARRSRAAALSWFVGWDAAALAAATDEQVIELQERFHRWGELLTERGLATLLGALRSESGVAGRVLGRADGDRAMTDLDHIAELLQLATSRRTTPAMLLDTFENLTAGGKADEPESDLAARRVESDAHAVQIMTTYVAKGLEFPVVCCPSLCASTPVSPTSIDPVFWDPAAGRRTVDVAAGVAWPDADAAEARRARALQDAIGSNLRVLYVALTRAKHHTALWWQPTEDARRTGLARVLFARDEDGHIDREHFTAPRVACPDDGDDVRAALAPIVAAASGLLEVVDVDAADPAPRRWGAPRALAPGDLSCAALPHAPDRRRRRWSFTMIADRAHRAAPGSPTDADTDAVADHVTDPFDASLGDAGDADEHRPPAPDEPAEPVPLATVRGGRGFGTLVHEVLEQVDFTADDLEGAVAAAVADRLSWNPWDVDVAVLTTGLAAALRTPLGPPFAGRPLTALARTDRLDELAFDLTVGERGRHPADAEVGRLLLAHLATDDPLRGWAERVAEGPFAVRLAGQLTGSIDLVARVRAPGATDRFLVVDYKTNRLDLGGADTVEAYRPDRLARAMADHDYPLQALLYSVALHRYLRWRLPGYDPSSHLGGIAYLFVRGLAGPATPTVDSEPHGLFSWRPPAALVVELSDLLDGAPLTTGTVR